MKIGAMAAMLAAMMTNGVGSAGATPATVGIVEGPANATHRITIVSAYSCPYCRVLDTQGMDDLRRIWTKRGLQIETVPFVISPTDIPASIAATCGDPSGYARRSTILFRAQPDILGNWNGADVDAKRTAVAKARGAGAPEIARLSGILTLASSLRLTRRELSACLADPKRQRMPAARMKAADARWKIEGTPTVLLDDQKIGSSWDDVRRKLSTTYGVKG